MSTANTPHIAVAKFAADQGTKITAHTADPGKTGADQAGTASGATTWAAGSIATEGGTEYAIVPGSGVVLSIPGGATITHWGQWNGSTFLRGYPLDGSITVNGTGSVNVTVTPRIRLRG